MPPAGATPTETRFYEAVRAVVDGHRVRLSELLADEPSLVTARGRAPHRATLLHYVAANGVEDDLQRTPANAPEIARLLCASGADVDAGAGDEACGTPLELLVSSWHPFERGVQEELVRVLVAGGARLDGPLGDGRPLTVALVFGYTRAAETLAELGARRDNLFFASGLGHLDAVVAWFRADGSLREEAVETYVPLKGLGPSDSPPDDPRRIVQEAFHFAVTHGRVDVADYLLQRGADPNAPTRGHHCELPLVQALFLHRTAIVPWLLQAGAAPDRRDAKRQMTAIEHTERFGPASARPLLGLD